MKTEICIWSKIGSTPITNRSGQFCDELIRTTIDCTDPSDAAAQTKALMEATPYAARGYFNMPDHWNQNTRSMWL